MESVNQSGLKVCIKEIESHFIFYFVKFKLRLLRKKVTLLLYTILKHS